MLKVMGGFEKPTDVTALEKSVFNALSERLDIAQAHIQTLSSKGVDGMGCIPYQYCTTSITFAEVRVGMVKTKGK